MTLKSKVLVAAGGITVLAVGTAVIVIATPALAVQASATAVSYALANGCLIIKEILSGIFSAGAIWYLWDYLRPCSSSSRAHRHRHESHLVPAQPYHTGWEPDSIALSPRPRTSFQSHHSQHRGRPRSNSVISLLSEFELELPVSVFDTPRSPALAGTPFSVDARSRTKGWAFRNPLHFHPSIHPFFAPFFTNFAACSWGTKKKSLGVDNHTYIHLPPLFLHAHIHTCTYQINNPLLT
ncbi:MAG: hypothetical protein JOS17DRAFT_496272 [Linnemannia elongata]|nr:MAG: hypothetical protein JOS17DRAFT_496272 [Linnemannia elongata]